MRRAFAFFQVLFLNERLAPFTIPAAVLGLIDVTGVVDAIKKLSHASYMTLFRSPDKVVV